MVHSPLILRHIKVSNEFKTLKCKIEGLWKKLTGKEIIKDVVEDEAEKEHKENQEQQDNITSQEHERALNGAYKSF